MYKMNIIEENIKLKLETKYNFHCTDFLSISMKNIAVHFYFSWN